MEFDEISLVIPCLEMAADCGYDDLDAEQPGLVRAFKTHFSFEQCPQSKGAKYIYMARNPVDVRFPVCFQFSSLLVKLELITLRVHALSCYKFGLHIGPTG